MAVLTDARGAELAEGASVPVLVVSDPRAVLGDVAALVYGRAARDLTLVGITGTNGKTTTAYLVEAGLRALGEPTGLLGTVETRVDDTRIKSVRTTPEATDLHALFAVMREAGAADVVMEVSSHALAQHRVDGAVFDVALFTNLSQDHLDFHETMEDYYAAKALLFTPTYSRRGVVCVDDAWGARLARRERGPGGHRRLASRVAGRLGGPSPRLAGVHADRTGRGRSSSSAGFPATSTSSTPRWPRCACWSSATPSTGSSRRCATSRWSPAAWRS